MGFLGDTPYMKFPFRVGESGVAVSDRIRHVREQVEQVLYTDPGERVFRPEFGAGLRALVFEPNNSALRELSRKRLTHSLTEALRGEVDPRSLNIEVQPRNGVDSELVIVISYTLTAVRHEEQQEFEVSF
ncbi:GPW/gp25 family protein [Nitrospina gracilis]|uniref:GPW/gp25 family protein n=1 Tax=Nitrospina gracilis TaxID=35801 RepID=UPI001F288E91|nr:GPW/gp25 family protein [Nitrospina gracilis]MCF8721633.1 phage baseplate assembly protein W [Nitrospina gracilis Nb-211]